MRQYQEERLSISQRVVRRFVWLLRDGQFEFAEFLSALALIGWGFWLLAPWWETFNSSPSFQAMAYVAPEWVWGATVAILGLCQMAAFVGEHRNVRIATALGGVFIWSSVSLMFGLGNIASTGAIAYALFALSSLWALWRLAIND